jgi:hypothetical protein
MGFFDELDGTSVAVGVGIGLGVGFIGWFLMPANDEEMWKKVREQAKEGAKEGSSEVLGAEVGAISQKIVEGAKDRAKEGFEEALGTVSEKVAQDAAETAATKVGNAIFHQIEKGLLLTIVPQIMAATKATTEPVSQQGGGES